MNPVIEKIVKPVVDRSLSLVTMGFENSRRAAETTSEWIASSTRTVSLVSDKALKLNNISHKTVAKLLTVQTDMVSGNLDAAAKRLDIAANADNLRNLWADQVELLPATRKRMTKTAQNVVGIFAESGEDLRELVTETVEDFGKRGSKVAKHAKKTTKSAKKTAKKTARKAVKKTTSAAKATKKKAKRVTKTAKKTAKRKTRKAA